MPTSEFELPSGPDIWQNFPEFPVDGEEGLQSSDIFEGFAFNEFMELSPRASAESFAAHGFPHPMPACLAPKGCGAGKDRRRLNNRQAQVRYRQRQKERADSLESELAQTSAKLKELQVMQKALTAKNELLVKLLQLSKQEESRPFPDLPANTVQDLYKQRGFKTLLDPVFAASQTVPTLRLTIFDTGEQFVPVQDIGQMDLQRFCRIYRMYISQMAACLAELALEEVSEQAQAVTTSRVRELVIECSSLLAITMMSNPSLYKDLQQCNLGEGMVSSNPDQAADSHNVLKAMQYTGHQIDDLLQLRQLFCQRMGQLARDRKALLANLHQCKMDWPNHVSDKLTDMTRWSDLLRENAAEEYRSYMQILTASCRGVSTCKQLATGFVCAFPWLLRMSKLIKVETTRRGLPSTQELMADISIDDAQHAANWDLEVSQYLQGLTEHDLDVHVPLSVSAASHFPVAPEPDLC